MFVLKKYIFILLFFLIYLEFFLSVIIDEVLFFHYRESLPRLCKCYKNFVYLKKIFYILIDTRITNLDACTDMKFCLL